jgi:hypothetical protein
MTVDCIDNQPSSDGRKKAYILILHTEQITNLALIILEITWRIHHDLVQRKHNYAIVDESILLIDDAQNLIISGPVPQEIVMNSMNWNQNWKLVALQRQLANGFIWSKKLLKGKTKEGGVLLLRAYKKHLKTKL